MASKTNPRSSQSFTKTACYRCNKNVFQLEKIIVDDHCLHESCFVCETCSQRLTSSNYVETDGKYYCLKDSHAIQSDKNISNNLDTSTSKTKEKTCPLCQKSVHSAEGVVLDNEDLVHRSCFICNECKTPLSLGNFHTVQDKFFCTRHFFQRSTSDANVNGRKARDFLAGSLDADPLQSSFSDLEKQEKKLQQDNNSSEVATEATNDAEPNKPSENPSTDENVNLHPGDIPRKHNESHNEVSDEGRDPDTARSVSISETDYQDLTDDDPDKVESDVTTASEKSEGATKSATIVQNKDEKEVKSPRDSLKNSRSKDRKKTKTRSSRKDSEDSKSKKKKKKKTEKSETEENTEDKDGGRKRGRRDKSQRKLRKNTSSLKVDLENEDSKEDKAPKKKAKRGIFNIKKKNPRSSGRKDSVDESPSHSPSLTSFVTSRFRTKKRDGSTDSLPKPVKEPVRNVPIGKLEESSEEEDDEGDLAPLKSPEKKNRISRLASKESVKGGMPTRAVTSPLPTVEAKSPVVQKVLPVSLETPLGFQPISFLSVCENTLEEDIPLHALHLPKENKEKSEYEWTSYELNREFAPLELDLPDDVISQPADEKEKILQSGFFEPTVIKIGLVGVHRRLLEFTSILSTTYPFGTKFIGGSNISSQALEILRERHGESFQEFALTSLLQENLDWIFVDSQYVNTVEYIEAALKAGKHVFCEKPVCTSVADCLRLRDAHKQSGRRFIGGFVWRLVPFYQEIYDILHCGILGEIVSVEVNNLLDPSEGGLLMKGWARNKKNSHSPLFDTFCFEIDILNWLLDSIPSRVGSFSGLNIYVPKNKPASPEELEPYLDWHIKPVDPDISPADPFSSDKDIDDNHVFIMEYRNRTRATCHINTNSAFPQRRILICGVKGTLEGDLYTGMIRFKTIGDQYETNLIQVTPGLAHGGGDQQMMEDLVDITRNLPANCFEAEELFPSIITVLGIDQSKEKGTIVDLESQWEQLGV